MNPPSEGSDKGIEAGPPIEPEPSGVGAVTSTAAHPVGWIRRTLRLFGPGLVTGAADDDPSGIATYSSVGAQFGPSMLWTMPVIYPFMAAIQEISARLGRVTGRGIAGNMRRFYPAWMLYVIIVLLLLQTLSTSGRTSGQWAPLSIC